jgi:hypothetical protein
VTEPLGPVIIGAREIYDRVVAVGAVVDRVSAQLVDIAQDLRDHETRIRSLEKARWPMPALAVLVSIAALALAFFKR